MFFSLLSAYSRSNVFPSGSKPAAMGSAFISQYNPFAVYHNQAGLAGMEKTSVSIFYESRFFSPNVSLSHMASRAIVATFPTGPGTFAVQYNSFGPPQWAESNVGISYGMFLSDKLSAGIQLNYFTTRLPEENAWAMTAGFEAGFIYQLTERTFAGLHVANPYTPEINTLSYRETIPWRIRAGGHTRFNEDFLFSYEIEKMEGYRSMLKFGGEWKAANNFFLRGGLNTSPARVFAGFGYEANFVTIDLSFSNHYILGYVPSASVIFYL
jgi:hypothetical protein